jgi:hypothetical protein
MLQYPAQIALIEEGHRGRASRYVFEDRILAAPAPTSYEWLVRTEKPIHRANFDEDQLAAVGLEREAEALGELADSLTGSALIKLSLKRSRTTGCIWQTEQRTFVLFEFEADARAFAQAIDGGYRRLNDGERWLSGEPAG